MIRISGPRASNSAYGIVVLHVARGARAGSPVAMVRNGDGIELDCKNGRLHLEVSGTDLSDRLVAWPEQRRDDP